MGKYKQAYLDAMKPGKTLKFYMNEAPKVEDFYQIGETMATKKKIKKTEVEVDYSVVNDKATGDPVAGHAFVKVLKEMTEGYNTLYEKGLSTSMIAILVAHYGGCTVNEATAVFNGIKELSAKLKYKNSDEDLPEFD